MKQNSKIHDLLQVAWVSGSHRPAAMYTLMATLAAMSEGLGVLALVPVLSANSLEHAGFVYSLSIKLSETIDIAPAGSGIVLLFIFMVMRAFAIQFQGRSGYLLKQRLNDNLIKNYMASLSSARFSSAIEDPASLHQNILGPIVSRIGNAFQSFLDLVIAITITCSYLTISLIFSPQLTLATCIALTPLGLLALRTGKKFKDLGIELTAGSEKFQSISHRITTNLRLVKLRQNDFSVADTISTSLRKIRKIESNYIKSASARKATLQIIGAAIVCLISFWSIVSYEMASAQILVVIILFGRLLPVLLRIQSHLESIRFNLPALANYSLKKEKLDSAKEKVCNRFEKTVNNRRGDTNSALSESYTGENCKALDFNSQIEICKLKFQHPGESSDALEIEHLKIEKGTIVVFTGESGSGKSTLLDLLSGLLLPSTGSILVDETEVTQINCGLWRQTISYMPQTSSFFSGSIRDNLLWGREFHDDEIKRALKLAGAEFVFNLEKGLDSSMKDNGQNFSGGQRRRLALACALIGDSQLVLLDEPTSELDADNRIIVSECLNALRGKQTIVIATHDAEIYQMADKLYKINSGRLYTLQGSPEIVSSNAYPSQS